MKKKAQISRATLRRKPAGTATRTHPRRTMDAPGERALMLWRTVQDHQQLERLNTHLQGLYAELGKRCFERLQDPRHPLQDQSEIEELTARIAEFRRQRSGCEPRRAPSSNHRPPAKRAGRRLAGRPRRP